jgi:hypothetical protein
MAAGEFSDSVAQLPPKPYNDTCLCHQAQQMFGFRKALK